MTAKYITPKYNGVFGSQLMSILVAKLFSADMSKYEFVFSKQLTEFLKSVLFPSQGSYKVQIPVFFSLSENYLHTRIKDGMIFNELFKGSDTRKEFFEKIIEVVTLLGGELSDVI